MGKKATETRPEKDRRKRKRMRTVKMLNINCLAASREWHNSFVYSAFYTREVGPLRIVLECLSGCVINVCIQETFTSSMWFNYRQQLKEKACSISRICFDVVH